MVEKENQLLEAQANLDKEKQLFLEHVQNNTNNDINTQNQINNAAQNINNQQQILDNNFQVVQNQFDEVEQAKQILTNEGQKLLELAAKLREEEEQKQRNERDVEMIDKTNERERDSRLRLSNTRLKRSQEEFDRRKERHQEIINRQKGFDKNPLPSYPAQILQQQQQQQEQQQQLLPSAPFEDPPVGNRPPQFNEAALYVQDRMEQIDELPISNETEKEYREKSIDAKEKLKEYVASSIPRQQSNEERERNDLIKAIELSQAEDAKALAMIDERKSRGVYSIEPNTRFGTDLTNDRGKRNVVQYQQPKRFLRSENESNSSLKSADIRLEISDLDDLLEPIRGYANEFFERYDPEVWSNVANIMNHFQSLDPLTLSCVLQKVISHSGKKTLAEIINWISTKPEFLDTFNKSHTQCVMDMALIRSAMVGRVPVTTDMIQAIRDLHNFIRENLNMMLTWRQLQQR